MAFIIKKFSCVKNGRCRYDHALLAFRLTSLCTQDKQLLASVSREPELVHQSQYVDQDDRLEARTDEMFHQWLTMPWYHGKITRQTAERRLTRAGKGNGEFNCNLYFDANYVL